MLVREFTVGRCVMGRLAPGDDLLVALESLVRERNIRSGQVHFRCFEGPGGAGQFIKW